VRRGVSRERRRRRKIGDERRRDVNERKSGETKRSVEEWRREAMRE
jgi:hypothetical protein